MSRAIIFGSKPLVCTSTDILRVILRKNVDILIMVLIIFIFTCFVQNYTVAFVAVKNGGWV